MADVPRALLRELAAAKVPLGSRFALCVLWTYATAVEAQAARQTGTSVLVRVGRPTIAAVTGEDTRSIRRHLERLERAGAIGRVDGDDLAISLYYATRSPRTDESGGDRAVLGPTSPGGPTSPTQADRRVRPPDRAVLAPGPTSPPPRTDESSEYPEKSPALGPQEKFAQSNNDPEQPPPRAKRPVEEEPAPPAQGLDARTILVELCQRPHPAGCARIKPHHHNVVALSELLSEHVEEVTGEVLPGVDGAELLSVCADYLRVLEEREDQRRFWGPKMWGPRAWPVIVSIVEQARAAWAKAAAERRDQERREAPVRAGEEAARAEALAQTEDDLAATLARVMGTTTEDARARARAVRSTT